MSGYEVFVYGLAAWFTVCVAFRAACEWGPRRVRGCWLCGLRIHMRV